jgi:O-succinylbenzoic acid--CoA ligase
MVLEDFPTGTVQPTVFKTAPRVIPTDIQLIIATSGSSGQPKGVMLSRDNLYTSAMQANQALDLRREDCWLHTMPMFHIAGMAINIRCAQAGASLLLQTEFDPARVWQALETHTITHLSLVPAMLNRLLGLSERKPPKSLKMVLVGGGPLHPQLADRARRAGWPLVVSYGMSETASLCALDRSRLAGLKSGCVGRPLPGFQLDITQGGGVRVAGRAVMVGYANPQLKPGKGVDGGWLETGDLGYWDSDGDLCVSGRADELLNSAGRRIHPSEVEVLLDDCYGLKEVAVISRQDPVWGDRLMAVYSGQITEKALDGWCRENLPGYLRPRDFKRVAALPKNLTGKLDRFSLKRKFSPETVKES